jgi:hypothetical protein
MLSPKCLRTPSTVRRDLVLPLLHIIYPFLKSYDFSLNHRRRWQGFIDRLRRAMQQSGATAHKPPASRCHAGQLFDHSTISANAAASLFARPPPLSSYCTLPLL